MSPIFVYKCPCGHEFERLETFDPDRDTRICPKCERPAKRQIAGAAFRIYGQGVYKPNKRD